MRSSGFLREHVRLQAGKLPETLSTLFEEFVSWKLSGVLNRRLQLRCTTPISLSCMSTPFPLARLVDDILVLSFAYLHVSDLAALARVSKRFYRLATCNYLWNEKIRQRSLVLTPDVANSIPKSNLEDFSGILRRERKWCSPAVLGLSESELRSVHLQLVAIAADSANPSLRFRDKSYPVNSHTAIRWCRYLPRLVCYTKDFNFELVTDSREVHSDVSVTYAKLARCGSAKRSIYFPNIAACIDGIVLHISPPPPPLAPAPEACAEPGYYKFLYRHAIVELHELCYMCAKNLRCVCLGHLQLVCGRCWRENDLDLFMSPDQAWEEFFMEEADLQGTADWCTKDTKMRRAWAVTPKRRRWDPPLSAPPASAPPASSSSPPLSARFYREFQVAYFAVLKWGSTIAIERKRAQRTAALGQQATCAKLADILALASFPAYDVEMTERGKRKRATGKEDTDYRDTPAGSPPAPVPAEEAERRPARRSKRTAALKRKSYVYDDLDVIAESALTDSFRWGVKL